LAEIASLEFHDIMRQVTLIR